MVYKISLAVKSPTKIKKYSGRCNRSFTMNVAFSTKKRARQMPGLLKYICINDY